MFIHCTKKAEKLIRETGLFNDDHKKATFIKEGTVNDALFHWHLNTVDVNGSYLLVLTHDVSSVALTFYMNDTATIKNQLTVFLPPAVNSIFLRAKCSNLFVEKYMSQSKDLIFTSARDQKHLSKNAVACRYVKQSSGELKTETIFQSQLTEKYNDMPKKSIGYQTPNEILLSQSKAWIVNRQVKTRCYLHYDFKFRKKVQHAYYLFFPFFASFFSLLCL